MKKNMEKTYSLEFTRSAKCEAAKRGLNIATLESYLRHEMEKDGYHGGEGAKCYPPKLFFHIVDYDADKPWMIVGDGKNGVTVDSSSYVEVRTIQHGPFKGKKLTMPRADELIDLSDDDGD